MASKIPLSLALAVGITTVGLPGPALSKDTPKTNLMSSWPTLPGSNTPPTSNTPPPASDDNADNASKAAPAKPAAPKPAAPKPAPVAAAVPEVPVVNAVDAARFIDQVNAQDKAAYPSETAAAWLSETYINDDSQLLAARANELSLARQSDQIEGSKKFTGLQLPQNTARPMLMIKTSNPMPAPSDPAKRAELAALATRLDQEYGAGKYCPPGKAECLNIEQLSDVIDHSHDPKALADAWAGWHSISRPMRSDYTRMVDLMNQGARELGYKDTGELWRANYDMSPADFEATTDRLWSQVKPLYSGLQCYVHNRLDQWYPGAIGSNGLIPADMLGNMWAQDWSNVYSLVQPYAGVGKMDIDSVMQKRHDELDAKMMDQFRSRYAQEHANQAPSIAEQADEEHKVDIEYARQMAKISEDFYTSVGFPALPASFYQKSMLTRPRDRDVVCHASAWDMNQSGDVRIKMCIKPDEESLETIHHEMGHIYYYLMYNGLPFLYQTGANDGFHEAIGDTITLSLTPQHLVKVGLLPDADSSQEAVVNAQMKRALAKIAFLPFGKLIDEWRWKVFSGEVQPADYNKAWWALREKYQGVKAPVARSEADFDPGAKYHIAANVPYTRYFLSFVLQFQFQKALCTAAGYNGPLYACDIYGSKAAGQKYMAMLKDGASMPWQDALQKLTGTRDIDAAALIEYFQPLQQFLQQQNAGKTCGWTEDSNPLQAAVAWTPLQSAANTN